MDPSRFDVFSDHMEKGFQKSERERSINEFAVMPMCIVNINDDIEKASQPARENIVSMSAEWEQGTKIFIMTMQRE